MSLSRLSRRSLVTGAAGAGAALFAAAPRAAAAATIVPPPSPYASKLPHQIEAERLVDYLRMRPWSDNANRYKTADSESDEFEGLYTSVKWGASGHPEQFSSLAQCSSFITLVLEQAYGPASAHGGLPGYGWATKEFFQQYFKTTKRFPTAELFQQGFLETATALNPRFNAVTKPVNLRAGDLVAFDYDPNSTSVPYTGHIVMIRERKGTWSDPAIDAQVGSNVIPYVFEIIDCTSDPHGNPNIAGATDLYRAFPDTRIEEPADANAHWAEHNGAGYGHMIFYADATTKLFAGYRWSVNSPTPRKIAERPIAAARIDLD
ncbi:hypothetical protein [Streptomyces sp. NPDC002082]|uniref:hypothetical protein n=1 Tax=Streptomyces sp. NPDC002082 TaxID=3154772 RepID=UPI0033261907